MFTQDPMLGNQTQFQAEQAKPVPIALTTTGYSARHGKSRMEAPWAAAWAPDEALSFLNMCRSEETLADRQAKASVLTWMEGSRNDGGRRV